MRGREIYDKVIAGNAVAIYRIATLESASLAVYCGKRTPVYMKRIYIKEEVCIGCRLCEVYCQVEHSQSKDLVKAFKREHPQPLPLSRLEERKPVSFSVRCYHCAEPPCVYACLTGALQKNPESGVVTVDIEKCVGCWTCILACPFGAIRQDVPQGKMAKCDLCPEKDMPVCVSNCPNEALVYAEIENDVSWVKGSK